MKKQLHFLATFIIIVPLIWLAWIWGRLPQEVPTHFSWDGTPDAYGSKTILLWVQVLLCVVNGAAYLLLCNAWRIDPRKHAAENRGRMQKMAFAISLFIALVQCCILYATRSGSPLWGHIVFVGVGLLFTVMGNYMHHIKPNYIAGFRIPWTLNNEENWRRTHQLAGRIWFAGGLLFALVSTTLSMKTGIIFLLAITLLMLLIPAVYSYSQFKKHNA